LDSKLVTASLVALLVVATAALGLTFGGGSSFQNPAGGGPAGATQSETKTGTFPEVIVKAEAHRLITENFIFVSGPNVTVSTGGSSGVFVDPLPWPLAGLQVVLTEQAEVGVPPTKFGGPQSYSITTNSSGIGVAYVLPGNYTVTASGSYFNFTGSISARVSTMTYLQVTVNPALESVITVVVSNQDGVLGVEPTAAIYADVAGTPYLTATTPYFLVGALPGTFVLRTLAVHILGSYPSLEGTWIVMEPAAPYSAVPSYGVNLLHYAANSTVSYAPE
jgi:hypothetical protein